MISHMTIRQLLRNSKLSPLDAEILLSFVLKKLKEYFLAHPEKKLSQQQIRKFNSLLLRRILGEPVAYLIGQKEFFGLDFLVDKNVLIPRPETEFLVEASLQQIRNNELGIMNVIDIGTGSGNIIISISKNVPAAMRNKINFYATDISSKALIVARKNAKVHGVEKLITFSKSDLLEYFLKKKAILEEKTIIIANLPYVSPIFYKKHFQSLRFEPKSALLSFESGLKHYNQLLKEIQKAIRIANFQLPFSVILEISPEQKSALQKIVKGGFPKASIDFQKDLAGKWRMASINIA
jgi:release factor glutamine methyltransferase